MPDNKDGVWRCSRTECALVQQRLDHLQMQSHAQKRQCTKPTTDVMRESTHRDSRSRRHTPLQNPIAPVHDQQWVEVPVLRQELLDIVPVQIIGSCAFELVRVVCSSADERVTAVHIRWLRSEPRIAVYPSRQQFTVRVSAPRNVGEN